MDAGGWILLLIVVACVIALIIISKKRKELEESISHEIEAGEGASSDKPVDNIPSPVDGTPQVTIYEYCSMSKMRLCSLCDGENDLSATHCRICGQKLN